jgi:5-methylcytosine-specific restriction enzyme subunit McrC
LDEVTLLPSLGASAATPALLNRLNRRLEPLLNLARLFLDGGVMQLAAGDVSAFAFVFDMNRVFESFVVNFIRKHRDKILPDLRECDLLPQTRGALRSLARCRGERVFHLKPDLAVRRGDTFPLLVDAKYKRLDANMFGAGVAQADFNQMFAYAHRYDCPRVVMLYPQSADRGSAFCQEFVLEGTDGTTVIAATVDIGVDLGAKQGLRQVAERLKGLFDTDPCQTSRARKSLP